MKKVVFLHPAYFEQSMGGAEYQISLLIEFLLQQSSELEVHHIFEENQKPIENPFGIQLHPLKKVKISKRFGNRWFLYRKPILKALEEIQPDVIYTRFFSSWSGIAADYARRNSCIHVWALASDSDVTRLKDPVPFSKLLDRIENKWVAEAFRSANAILTQNNYQHERLKSVYGKEGVLIRQSSATCPEERIVKPESVLNVCWVANLKPIKQPDLFVKLAERFAEDPSISFTMIGRPDDQYSKLVSSASERLPNFQYLGELSNEEVNEHLCASHVLVNTSQFEGFSNTFVQAWMRKAIVMSLNSDPDNLLKEQQIGFLLNSLDAMEDKLTELLQDKRILSEMGQKAFDYANECHSYQKNMEVLTEIMKINE